MNPEQLLINKSSKSDKCKKLTPFLIMWVFILFLYICYYAFYIIPLITESYWLNNYSNTQSTENSFESNSQNKKGWIFFCLLNYVFFWFIYSMKMTMMSDPGMPPDIESRWSDKMETYVSDLIDMTRANLHQINKEIDEEESNRKVVEAIEVLKTDGTFRFCKVCKRFKPLRSHHCRECKKCVLKMDHHSKWILNCVGFKNYKYFMNMLIYALLTLLIYLLSYIECVIDVLLNPFLDDLSINFILVIISFVLALLLFIIVLVITCYHFWLIFKGKTTFEKLKEKKIEKKEKTKKTNLISYNNGFIKNFKEVFNENPLTWFFPCNLNIRNNGLYEEYEEVLLGRNNNARNYELTEII